MTKQQVHSGRPRGSRFRLHVTIFLGITLVASCSSPNRFASETPAPITVGDGDSTVAGDMLEVEIRPSEEISISIPGIVDISGPAGSLAGSVRITPVELSLPKLGDLDVLGTGGIKVDGAEPTQPLTLAFTVPAAATGTEIAAVHVAADGTVEVLPSTLTGNQLIVPAESFSIVGWVSFAWNFVSGTTEPNSCGAPPGWAAVLGHPESVHACFSTNVDQASGRTRAELDIKSNRGTWQEVYLPAVPVDYVWAEGQPGWAIDLYRWALHEGGEYVLLPPDSRITMGFIQPNAYTTAAVTVSPPDSWLYVLSTATAVADLAGWKTKDIKIVSSIGAGLKCLGGGVFPVAAPHTPSNGGFDKIGLLRCVVQELKALATDPQKWVDNLPDVLRKHIPQADFVAITRRAKSAGKAALVLSLVMFSAGMFNQISDQAIAAFGSLTASQVVVGLDGKPKQDKSNANTTADAPVQPPVQPPVPAPVVPPVAPSTTPPTMGAFQVGVSGTSVTMQGSIGWAAGADPITCSFLIDGGLGYSSQCGTTPSLTRVYAAGDHTFQLRVCDRFNLCVSSEVMTRTVGTGTPQPPASPPTAATYVEYTGGVARTWTNYSNAGGTEGPTIPKNAAVQISCRLTGFAVKNGNTWWYRIAQAPWSNNFYVSADIFYNTPGMTSGPVAGTPYVDPAVPMC